MEQSTILLLEELKNMGHEVELLSLNEMGPLAPVLEKAGIPASAIGYAGRWGWRSFLPLRRALQAKKVDALVMVGHNLMAMLALGDFCRERRILSLHYHHEGVKPTWGWRLIYRVAVWRFKYIIYPSRFIMDEALRTAPQLATSKRLISYPIPYPFTLPAKVEEAQRMDFRRQNGLSAEDKVVGNAGWLILRKRWDVFLRVAAEVSKKVPRARFLVAGNGPERDKLQRLAGELGITDRVIWLGWQKNLESFYRALDVMVFNSDWDAMGRTPVEAMSYGVPVVASVEHGGLKEVLCSEEFGFLSETHDIQLLAQKVIRFLEDKELATATGSRARARIEEIGSPRLHAERVLDLLNGKYSPKGSPVLL